MLDLTCACQIGNGVISGWMNINEWYCIQTNNTKGNRYVMRTAGAVKTPYVYMAVKNQQVEKIDSDGWIYSADIFMKCDKTLTVNGVLISGGSCSDDKSRIVKCVAGYVMINSSQSDSGIGVMCLPPSVLQDPRLDAYMKFGYYTPCEFTGLVHCNYKPETGLPEFLCPINYAVNKKVSSVECR